MISLQEFWQVAKTQILNNGKIMLCMIVAKQGSAPRGVGAHMLVLSNGQTIDTVGGGILEYQTKIKAQEHLSENKSGLMDFFLGNNDAGKEGMICGGRLQVLMKCLTKEDLPQIDIALDLIEENQSIVIAVDWQSDKFDFKIYSYNKEFIFKDKMQGKKSLLSIDEDKNAGSYREILKQRPIIYLFGGGYVSQEIAKLLPALEFDYVLLEERSEFANYDLFPTAKQIVVADYAEFEKYVQIKQSDFAVVVTSGHKSDTLLLNKLLKLNLTYIGAIGSRHKKAIVGKYLLEQGYTNEEINKIYLPIGIDIKAQTPAEIAISIVAQLIAQRAN